MNMLHNMYIPREIVADIINRADVPIDTRLAFRSYGVVPKKLHVDEQFTRKLDVLCRRRTHMYMLSKKRHMKSMCLERISARVKECESHIHVNVFVSICWDDEGAYDVRYTMRSVHFPTDFGYESPPKASKVYCSDIHTGHEVYIDY